MTRSTNVGPEPGGQLAARRAVGRARRIGRLGPLVEIARRDDAAVAHARHRPVDAPQVVAEEPAEPLQPGRVAHEGDVAPDVVGEAVPPPRDAEAADLGARLDDGDARARAGEHERRAEARGAGPEDQGVERRAPRARKARRMLRTRGSSATRAPRVNRGGTSVIRRGPWAGLYSAR